MPARGQNRFHVDFLVSGKLARVFAKVDPRWDRNDDRESILLHARDFGVVLESVDLKNSFARFGGVNPEKLKEFSEVVEKFNAGSVVAGDVIDDLGVRLECQA